MGQREKSLRTIDINRLGLNCNVKVSGSRGICVTLVYKGQRYQCHVVYLWRVLTRDATKSRYSRTCFHQGASNIERTYQAYFTVKVCHLLVIFWDKYHTFAVKILCLQTLLTCATSWSILGGFFLPAACANLTRNLRNDSLAMRNLFLARQIGECTLIDSIAHVALPPNYIARNLCQIQLLCCTPHLG